MRKLGPGSKRLVGRTAECVLSIGFLLAVPPQGAEASSVPVATPSLAPAKFSENAAHLAELPFGEECTTGPCAADPAPGTGQPLRFTAKERDPETGLDYFGARYYSSKVGRFTTVDPAMELRRKLQDPQGWNRYAYARNNPLRYVDPDGRSWVTKAGKLILKGGDVAATFADVAADAAVFASPDPAVGPAARMVAVLSIVSEGLPVSVGDAKHGLQLLKKIPNPFGKKGGPAHQEKVAELVEDMRRRGLDPDTEMMVETPGGNKSRRFVDAAGREPATGDVVEMHQVGRQTGSGAPVSRERKAMDDIEAAKGQRPEFHPYNK